MPYCRYSPLADSQSAGGGGCQPPSLLLSTSSYARSRMGSTMHLPPAPTSHRYLAATWDKQSHRCGSLKCPAEAGFFLAEKAIGEPSSQPCPCKCSQSWQTHTRAQHAPHSHIPAALQGDNDDLMRPKAGLCGSWLR